MRSQSSYYVFHAVLGTVQYSEVLALPISSWVKAGTSPIWSLGGFPPSIKWGASQTGLSNSSSNKNYIPTQPLEGALAFMQQGSGKVRWLARAHIPPEARACLLPTCQASSAFCTVRAGKGRPRMHFTLLMPAATATPPPLSALREGDGDTENRDPQPGMMSPLMRDRGRVESAPDLSLLPKYLLNSPLNTSNSAECEQL